MIRCPTCNELDFYGYHKCPPLWFVLIVRHGPEAIGDEATDYDLEEDLPKSFAVYADSASDAAEKRVAKWDDGELACQGDEIAVIVYDADMANPLRFDVAGYIRRAYVASEHIAPIGLPKATESEAP